MKIPSVLALSLATSLLFSSATWAADEAKPNTPNPALAVTLTTPQNAKWATQITASGTLAPWQEAVSYTHLDVYKRQASCQGASVPLAVICVAHFAF